jgi:hypothetical protein
MKLLQTGLGAASKWKQEATCGDSRLLGCGAKYIIEQEDIYYEISNMQTSVRWLCPLCGVENWLALVELPLNMEIQNKKDYLVSTLEKIEKELLTITE